MIAPAYIEIAYHLLDQLKLVTDEDSLQLAPIKKPLAGAVLWGVYDDCALASFLLELFEGLTLFLVDPFEYPHPGALDGNKPVYTPAEFAQKRERAEFLKEHYGDRLQLVPLGVDEAAQHCADFTLDFVIVNGTWNFGDCQMAIASWVNKVRDDGVFGGKFFADSTSTKGAQKAVQQSKMASMLGGIGNVWWILRESA